MSWLRRFLRLRRQSSQVKLAVISAVLAAALAVDLAVYCRDFAATVLGPVEYVLERTQPGPVPETVLTQLRALDGVEGVSRQGEAIWMSEEKSLAVTVLSAQYLQDCYGLTGTGAFREYWLNPAAFTGFCGRDAPSVRLEGQRDGSREIGSFQLASALPEEESFAVTEGSSADMADSSRVRIRFGRGDPGDRARLESLGFSVANQEKLQSREHRAELWTARMKYGGLALVLAVILTGMLYRSGKDAVRL